MKVILENEELDPTCKMQCECGKEFWVDPCSEENLILKGTRLVPQCPSCGKIDDLEAEARSEWLDDPSAYEASARLLHKMYPDIVTYTVQVRVLEERNKLRALLDEAASIIDEHAPDYTVWRQAVDEYFQAIRK